MTDPAVHADSGDMSIDTGEAIARPVIDLRETPTTRVRVSRDDNPFEALTPPERMKLIIRVLCEIVAYGEVDELDPDAGLADTDSVSRPDHPAVSN